MSRVVAASVLALVIAACTPAATTNNSASPVPSTSSSPSRSPAALTSPSPVPRTTAFPDLPFVIGTDRGDLYTDLVNGQPAGQKIHICDGMVVDIVTYQRQALASCGRGGGETSWYLWDAATRQLQSIAKTGVHGAAFTGSGGVVYVDIGRSEPLAPISMTKLMLRDLASGTLTQLDERYGVANALRLTGEGVAVWRAKNNPAFVRSDAEAGTWILKGTTLVKYSQDELIASSGGLAVLETEPDQMSTGCCPVIITKTTVEQRLTPRDVSNEHVVALLEDGRVVAWRPTVDEYEGDIVIYERGTPTRVDHGNFSTWRIMRSGDWLVASNPSPSPALYAYRISDGAFASVAVVPGAFQALGMLSSP